MFDVVVEGLVEVGKLFVEYYYLSLNIYIDDDLVCFLWV